ncbi:centrosomal protein of 290 kDa [Aricia agestis]|uniref:centrosomal protein of 290 kDa n=1 Tax=Aricia agestis TaxID=91739 RepID=UPI001C20937F|nr:centrosomal protein of 290 kDa [Aricia agestis]
MESDWREILSLTQNEVRDIDKDKICESLAWMESDDIDLNFSDLKALFRLAQDILKYKTEQVNGLLGKLEIKSKKAKSKKKKIVTDSPDKSSDDVDEKISRQKEIIKNNKEVIEQLANEITELEQRRSKLQDSLEKADVDSESSRNTLSEMNTIAQLESDVLKRNKHIKKLMTDISVLEEENSQLKEKLAVLRDKLKESTVIITNITEQLLSKNRENDQLKDVIGSLEKDKTELEGEIENLKTDNIDFDSKCEKIEEDYKTKIQQYKNLLKVHKNEIQHLADRNIELQESLRQASHVTTSPKRQLVKEDAKVRELQEKLLEASEEILHSANLIKKLKTEIKHLKFTKQDRPFKIESEKRNESDDGKERNIISSLNKKNKELTAALHGAEEMVSIREQEIAEITSQLQLLQTDEGINSLIKGIKSKKRELKIKDQGIKSLVSEVNNLNQIIDNLQLENEYMREKLNIPVNKKVPTYGILQKHEEMRHKVNTLEKTLEECENKVITLEMEIKEKNDEIKTMHLFMKESGIDTKNRGEREINTESNSTEQMLSRESLLEENEGLRNGLTEILNFLKENSSSTSGILAVQCPSLDALLQSMEARRLSGWFSPHMKTIIELRTAIGSRDALLTALHESRKETYEIISKLNDETNKSLELQKQLEELKSEDKIVKQSKDRAVNESELKFCDQGSWLPPNELLDIDVTDKENLDNFIIKSNILFESQLKQSLQYFQNKFTQLHDEFNLMTVNFMSNKNKWSLQEEQYITQIESLKQKIQEYDEDQSSNHSPGLINTVSQSSLERKCLYLEEMYTNLRTVNKNLKEEFLEFKKRAILQTSEYELKNFNLLTTVIHLTDKIRNTIPVNVFMRQNSYLNDHILKYRQILDNNAFKYIESVDLTKRLDCDRLNLISRLHGNTNIENGDMNETINKKLVSIEQTIVQTQMRQILSELDKKSKEIDDLKDKLAKIQDNEAKLLDKLQFSQPDSEVIMLKNEIKILEENNKLANEKSHHLSTQLDVALAQLRAKEQNHVNNEIEINMLRHQILDLQSNGNSNIIIARLSEEILSSRIQTSERIQAIDILNSNLSKEREVRIDLKQQLLNYQKLSEHNIIKYENKIRTLHEVINLLREQYNGSIPLLSVENFISSLEDIYHKKYEVNEKLNEIDDIRSDFIRKNNAYKQIIALFQNSCLDEAENCPHLLKNVISENIQSSELEYYKDKLKTFESSHRKLMEKYYDLEKNFHLLNQPSHWDKKSNNLNGNGQQQLFLEDVHSDDEKSEGNETYTVLNEKRNNAFHSQIKNSKNQELLLQDDNQVKKIMDKRNKVDVEVQKNIEISAKEVQTDGEKKEVQTDGKKILELTMTLNNITSENKQIEKHLLDCKNVCQQRLEEINLLKRQNIEFDSKVKLLNDSCKQKDKTNKDLQSIIQSLRKQLDDHNKKQLWQQQNTYVSTKDNEILVESLKKIDADKNTILTEYKELLNSEKDNFRKSTKELQAKLIDLQAKIDQSETIEQAVSSENHLKETSTKYASKIVDLEDKCFNLERTLEENVSELNICKDEISRWKNLATERLNKIEQLSAQSKDMRNREMESYKSENQHWITQLSETQREQVELRNKLSEQKTIHYKQMTEKDNQIEQLRFTIKNLKTQVTNMQNMFSLHDPNFDLSAIVEVDEISDGISQQGSDKLEIKFESSTDLNDSQDDVKVPSSSTMIWQETLIERLRQEKQLINKQNAMLRRQIKALAARERRARLDAQNLKNQVFRITTNGSKVPTAESAALQGKIASLQAQLGSARRDAHSSVAIWDKWKRAQQASERWQTKYEEKCQEIKKLEVSLNLAKSAVSRLEKEKRMLLTSLNEMRQEKQITEKQEEEKVEKLFSYSEASNTPSTEALLSRIAAQQRRIVALEVAEKGNEPLVLEYEKSLAEITSLKGQVLKLESTLLESQIRSPVTPKKDHEPELKHWKNYCDTLKEENMQLTLRLNSCESVPTTTHQQRISDLEQTVLTLRGLVSKLQSEQKTVTPSRRIENIGGRSHPDKIRYQLETYRIEITNLKRSLQDKDLLLEKSKEMLKMAAEREEELLRENSVLHHQLQEMMESRGGFLSA